MLYNQVQIVNDNVLYLKKSVKKVNFMCFFIMRKKKKGAGLYPNQLNQNSWEVGGGHPSVAFNDVVADFPL